MYGHDAYASQPYASTPSAGGVAPVVYTYVASGGINFGGASLNAKVKDFIASGGVIFGGAALTTETDTYEGSGGLVFGGAAETSYREEAPARGGIPGPLPRKHEEWHYLPGPPVHYDYEGFGGIIFGGSAETRFVPARRRLARPPRPEPVEAIPTSDVVIRRWREENAEDEAILLMLIASDD